MMVKGTEHAQRVGPVANQTHCFALCVDATGWCSLMDRKLCPIPARKATGCCKSPSVIRTRAPNPGLTLTVVCVGRMYNLPSVRCGIATVLAPWHTLTIKEDGRGAGGRVCQSVERLAERRAVQRRPG